MCLNNSLAAAFTTVVTSFVSEILLPILSLLPFIERNFDEWFAVLRPGKHYGVGRGRGYNTLRQATDDGAVVMAYGYVERCFFFQRGALSFGCLLVGIMVCLSLYRLVSFCFLSW